MNNKVLIIILMAFLGFASCGKENGGEQIPDKEPHLSVNLMTLRLTYIVS